MKIFFNKIICILFLSFVFFLTFCNKGFCTEISPAKTPLTQGSVTIVKNDNFSALNYKIIPGDIISVSVYDEPNFLQPEIIVRPDGYATIDPIGEILVEGLNIQDLTRIIEKNFKNFLNDPIISVNIKEFNPPSIYIFGAVQKPGMYQQLTNGSKYYADSKNTTVRTDLTLSNIISNAGGISNNADLSNITVTSLNKKQTIIDLWKFIKDGDISQNIKLKSGDVIFVPKLDSIGINDENFKLLSKMSLFPATFPIRVIGEVKTGGTFNISGESPYLNTAVSNANGYTLDAKKTIVVVYRKADNEKLSKIFVDPFMNDFLLRPNDLVEVRKRTFMKVVAGSEYFTRIISPFLNTAYTYSSWNYILKINK